jgi:hypothetical protein
MAALKTLTSDAVAQIAVAAALSGSGQGGCKPRLCLRTVVL